MEWVKTTGKSVPEAIDAALDTLGVDESEAEIEVLEEPRAGLFGRTRGTARVQARVKPKPIRPKHERGRNRRGSEDASRGGRNRNRNRRSGGGKGGGGNSAGDGRAAAPAKVEERAEQAGSNGGPGRGDGGPGPSEDGQRRSGKRRRRRRGGGGGSGGGGEQKAMAGANDSAGGGQDQRDDRRKEPRGPRDKAPGRQDGSRGDDSASGGASVDEVATQLETFLTELTEAFGLDGPVTIDDSEEGILVGQIEGRHGLLVGPKGRTLDAVQELARIACQRSAPSSVRVKVDVGGYRAQRAEALGEFAGKAADRAVAEAAEVALEPMSPADRKAVHDALSEDPRVETRSIGSEPRRRVLVVPVAGNGAGPDDSAGGDGDGAANEAPDRDEDEYAESSGGDEEE